MQSAAACWAKQYLQSFNHKKSAINNQLSHYFYKLAGGSVTMHNQHRSVDYAHGKSSQDFGLPLAGS
jgi:hypothetical protein